MKPRLLIPLTLLALCACTGQKTADQRTAEAEQKLDHAGQVAKEQAGEAGKKLDRATLVAKVKTALAMDAGLRSMTSVKVDVSGDTVILSGTVQSEAQKQEVEHAASHVDGVAHVTDNLTIQQ